MKFTLTFTQDQIVPAKKKALEHIGSGATLKGFRQGKAPLDLIEKTTGQEKVIEETVSHLIPEAYSQYIKSQHLKPLTQPKISVKNMIPEGDWEFEVEIAEKPEVKLGKYVDAVKGGKTKDTIWTPEKGKVLEPHDATTKEDEESKKLTIIFDTLLKTCEVDIPDLLVDEEVNRALSRLVEQVNKLGLSIDQYLSSLGKKPEELREEYKTSAIDNLKLEFILDAIARDQKIESSDADLQEILKDIKDPKILESVQKNAMELASIRYSIVKHKVVDYLTTI